MKALLVCVVALGIASVLVCEAAANPVYTYRYRLTLELEAEGQARVGSSVVEVQTYRNPSWSLQPFETREKMTGEATLVDLGRGRVLVALLSGVEQEAVGHGKRKRGWVGFAPTGLLGRLFGIDYDWVKGENKGLAQLVLVRGKKAIELHQLPTLVSFRDVDDPKSMFIVDRDDFASALGADVRFKGASIEILDADITQGLEEKLPWLRTTKGYLNGDTVCRLMQLTPSMPFCAHQGHFIRKDR